jgi:hypothetical protein
MECADDPRQHIPIGPDSACVTFSPVLNSMMDFVRDYQRGDVKTQCDLVARSK